MRRSSPVDMLVKLRQRIFEFSEFFKKKAAVEKAEWIDIFYDRWPN